MLFSLSLTSGLEPLQCFRDPVDTVGLNLLTFDTTSFPPKLCDRPRSTATPATPEEPTTPELTAAPEDKPISALQAARDTV